MTVEECAREWNATPQYVREVAKSGIKSWATAVRFGKSKKFTYHINEDLFRKEELSQ